MLLFAPTLLSAVEEKFSITKFKIFEMVLRDIFEQGGRGFGLWILIIIFYVNLT